MYEKLVSHKPSSFFEKYVFCLLLCWMGFCSPDKSLGCTDALLTISHRLQKVLDAGMESYVVQLHFTAAFEWYKYISAGGSVLSICSFSPTAGRDCWSMVLTVSGSQSFQACHGEVCWELFCSSCKPANCLSGWEREYNAFASHHQTDLLLLPLLTGTLLGFRSGAITGATYCTKTKLRLYIVLSRYRTLNPPHGDLV